MKVPEYNNFFRAISSSDIFKKNLTNPIHAARPKIKNKIHKSAGMLSTINPIPVRDPDAIPNTTFE